MQIVADCNVAVRGGGGRVAAGGDGEEDGASRGVIGERYRRRRIRGGTEAGGVETRRVDTGVEGVSTERGRLLCAQTIPVRRCAGSHGAGGRGGKDEMKGVLPWTRKRDPGRVREKGGTER